MDEHYDVVAVGGGPAGAMAAWKSAQAGAKTLLLERDREIGLPVRCAEAASTAWFECYFEPQEKFIANRIDAQEFVSPDGMAVVVEGDDKGVVLERKIFDAHIATMAAGAGADIATRADATGMERLENGWKLNVTHQGKPICIEARIVIASDGIESRVARWAGVKTALSLKDLESAAQYDMVNIEIENPHHLYYYFGNEIAPGGYCWVFPKADRRANVGIGVLASRATKKTAKELLDEFIGARFPRGKAVGFVTGGVPIARPLKELALDNLLIAGDAARIVDPLSGGGIEAALLSGALAGETAGRAVLKNRCGRNFLKTYSEILFGRIGKTLGINSRIKNIVQESSDDEYCRITDLARKAAPGKMSLLRMYTIIVRNDPILLLNLAKLLFQR